MSDAVEIQGLTKRYAGHLAVDDLALSVPAGSIFGLLGPNGAGKSTTLRIALGILGRDAGRVLLLGKDPAAERGVLARIGYLPEERGLYKKMSVTDCIVFFARLKGVTAPEARRRAADWLERMSLGGWGGRRVETLSKGMQQKVQFITTVLHDPELVVLDEPFSGLDPVNQGVLRDTVVDAHRRGKTVLFSTHIIEHAEEICDHVAIISGGKKVLDGSLAAIRRSGGDRRWIVEVEGAPPDAESTLRSERTFASVASRPGGFSIELAPGAEPRAVLEAAARLAGVVTRVARADKTLREVFVERVGAGAAS